MRGDPGQVGGRSNWPFLSTELHSFDPKDLRPTGSTHVLQELFSITYRKR